MYRDVPVKGLTEGAFNGLPLPPPVASDVSLASLPPPAAGGGEPAGDITALAAFVEPIEPPNPADLASIMLSRLSWLASELR